MAFKDYSKRLWDWLTGTAATNPKVGIDGEIPAGTKLIGTVGIDQTTDGTTNRVVAKISQTAGENLVQLSGSKMELYGATVATRPAATSVAAGTTFTIVDDTQDFKTWMSNGVDWGEEI